MNAVFLNLTPHLYTKFAENSFTSSFTFPLLPEVVVSYQTFCFINDTRC